MEVVIIILLGAAAGAGAVGASIKKVREALECERKMLLCEEAAAGADNIKDIRMVAGMTQRAD
jgi:hypothetical protein